MQRKALLTITGSQDYNGDKDKIEMKTVGTIEHKDDSYIIRYTEAIENSNASLKSKLTIAKDESKVEMMKSGPYSSLLIIENQSGIFAITARNTAICSWVYSERM